MNSRVIDSFRKANHGKKSVFVGKVKSFSNLEHDVQFDHRKAALTLMGEETGFDEKSHIPLGFFDNLPLVVDISQKMFPVQVLSDGEMLLISKTFPDFQKRLNALPPKKSTASKPTRGEKGATILSGPVPATWPKGPVMALKPGTLKSNDGDAKEHFLWFNPQHMKPKSDHDLFLANVQVRYLKSNLKVGSKWKPAEISMDRGTGVWLDAGRFGNVPIVSGRLREFIEKLQANDLEFLPIRAKVKNETQDMFIMHPNRLVACFDATKSKLPPKTKGPGKEWVQGPPEKMILIHSKLPKEACFFRVAEYPAAVLVSSAMVEALRTEGFSGLDFVKP